MLGHLFETFGDKYYRELLAECVGDDTHSLLPFGSKVYSQNEEDGMIAEIFKRIGTTDQKFIEIGVSTGLECNTLKLLLEGWTGCWVEGSADKAAIIKKRCLSRSKKLLVFAISCFSRRTNWKFFKSKNFSNSYFSFNNSNACSFCCS